MSYRARTGENCLSPGQIPVRGQGIVSSLVRNSSDSSSTKGQPILFQASLWKSFLFCEEGKQQALQMGRLWENEVGAVLYLWDFFA